MVSARLIKKQGFIIAYEISEDTDAWLCGLEDSRFFYVDGSCPYKELALRAVISKCLNQNLEGEVFAHDGLGIDLKEFGFVKNNGFFSASAGAILLPRHCGK